MTPSRLSSALCGSLRHGVFLAGTALVAAAPQIASASCGNDMDCKGERVCEDDACVLPAGAGASSAPTGALSEVQVSELQRARSAGIASGVGGAGVLVFGAASAATALSDGTTSKVMGGLALVTMGVTAPIGGMGSAQARRTAAAAGLDVPSRALPITAWVGYGFALIDGAYILTVGIGGGTVEPPTILSVVALGTLSTVGLGYDAIHVSQSTLESGRQAEATPRPRVQAAPFVSPNRRGGATMGVTGRF
jgi:hypothetical protein